MKSIYIVKAIQKLKPTAEFSFIDDDYSTIKWDVLDGKAPTQAEIDAAIIQIKEDEVIENANRETLKSALLKKLGITAEEAQLLLA